MLGICNEKGLTGSTLLGRQILNKQLQLKVMNGECHGRKSIGPEVNV